MSVLSNSVPLYAAPLNTFSTAIFRHVLLQRGADFVFSELLVISTLHYDENFFKQKMACFKQDLPKTIFQIGAKDPSEIKTGVCLLKKLHPKIVEINLNAGCPQSRLQQAGVCGGLLHDMLAFTTVCKELVHQCAQAHCIPSVKLRTGLDENTIQIKQYLRIVFDCGIKKVYIHARPLRYNYTKPAQYGVFENLAKEFSQLELIFNGDVDSYERYSLLASMGARGVMVGRAHLSNPLIFEHIKEHKKSLSRYDPLLNDIGLVLREGKTYLSQTKKEFIVDFLKYSAQQSANLSTTRRLVLQFVKGVYDSKKVAQKIALASGVIFKYKK
ncbi:MAG: tRNA-dihydrouridine synthase family protein [Candidatus Nanoarchaeia archaeon]